MLATAKAYALTGAQRFVLAITWLWKQPLFRRALAILAGGALAWSCNYWPEEVRPLCVKLAPLFDIGE